MLRKFRLFCSDEGEAHSRNKSEGRGHFLPINASLPVIVSTVIFFEFQMSAKAKEDVKLFLENEKAVSKANDEKLDDEKVVEEKMQTYRALWNKRDASSKGKK